MSEIIIGNGVNDVLSELLWRFNAHVNSNAIEKEESRNGDVYRLPGVTQLVYNKPWERVLFSPTRDANPFFHLMEAFWMLSGEDHVAFPAEFNKRFLEYSDNGITVHGAYGYRWRNHFDANNSRYISTTDDANDQVLLIIQELAENPASRRAVLQMWDPRVDLGYDSKDVPCNLGVCFDVDVNGYLNMTVFNRSNDALWGACGANAVHMSLLQELIAGCLNYKIGKYRQVSNNMHIYTDILPAARWGTIASECSEFNASYYSRRRHVGDRYVTPTKIFRTQPEHHHKRVKQNWETALLNYVGFCKELDRFMSAVWDSVNGEHSKFEAYVPLEQYPILVVGDLLGTAWFLRKTDQSAAMGLLHGAMKHLGRYDWLLAAHQWMERRRK